MKPICCLLMVMTVVAVLCSAVASAAEPAFNPGPGSILVEYWRDVNGAAVADLTRNADFPDLPSEFALLKSFEIPSDQADNYGTRVTGWLLPPETGDYTFWIAADDAGELWLSDSADAKAKKKLAQVGEWTGPREWEKFPNQKSKPVHLEKGRKYYVEALQKEAGGGDNLAVGWQLPSGAKERPIPGSRLAPCPPPKISTAPVTVTIKVATPVPTKPGYHALTGTFTYKGKEFPFGFGLFLQDDFFTGKEKLPLITTMHNVVDALGGVTGGPEITPEGFALLTQKDIGADDRHSGDWPPVKFNPRKDAKFICLMPQCPKDRAFQSMPMSGVIVEEINWVEKNFPRMDGDRCYLTGFSYGGSCTWAVAQQFPERFAAIAPLSARIAPQAERSPEILKNVGVWCGVGRDDGDFFSACNQMAEIYTKAGHPNFHFTPIKGGGHHCYQAIYGNPDFWTWLLAQKRKPGTGAAK